MEKTVLKLCSVKNGDYLSYAALQRFTTMYEINKVVNPPIENTPLYAFEKKMHLEYFLPDWHKKSDVILFECEYEPFDSNPIILRNRIVIQEMYNLKDSEIQAFFSGNHNIPVSKITGNVYGTVLCKWIKPIRILSFLDLM